MNPDPHVGQHPAPVRVLVVDDHPVVRNGVIGMLAADDRIDVVAEAASGPEAVLAAGRHDPDVVLLDLRMPGGDGVPAIEALRRLDAHRPRILVLTTYESDRDVRSAVEAGADGYLLKALGRDDLVAAVLDTAAGRRVLTPSALTTLSGRRRTEELTDREREVLVAVAAGGTNASVARSLHLGEATVKTHLLHAFAKLGVRDRAAAVRVAYERGIL